MRDRNSRNDRQAKGAATKIGNFAAARALAREFFPRWSRGARARWVLAKLKTRAPRIPISSGWSHDLRAYWFQRTSRA